MRKDSEKVLEILLKMRAERNTDQIKTKASDFKDIPNIEKMKSSVIINVSDNGQANFAQDNATINAIQNNGMSGDELDKIVKSIMDNLKDLDKENADKIVDVVEMAREELVRPEPRSGRLRSCLSLIAPMIAVANGIPVLADNLQKFADYIQMLVH